MRKGIICPDCQQKIAPRPEPNVIDTRRVSRGAVIWRRRECRCGNRVTTYEVTETAPVEVEIKLIGVGLSPISKQLTTAPSGDTMPAMSMASIPLDKAPCEPTRESAPKGRASILPPFDELKQMVLDGVSHREIADRYGVTHQAVSAALVAGGFDTRKYKKEAVEKAVLRLHKEGLTPAEIERAGVSSNGYIHEIIRAAGFTPHPRRLLQPGCSLCEARPYARGYCKRCYGLWLTRRKEKHRG